MQATFKSPLLLSWQSCVPLFAGIESYGLLALIQLYFSNLAGL
jgi:hypothetical protein